MDKFELHNYSYIRAVDNIGFDPTASITNVMSIRRGAKDRPWPPNCFLEFMRGVKMSLLTLSNLEGTVCGLLLQSNYIFFFFYMKSH
jgi:hypothetical protein